MELLNVLQSPTTVFDAVYLAVLFTALLLKPDRISNVVRFRWACLLFVICLFLPSFINVFSYYFTPDRVNVTRNVGYGLFRVSGWLSLVSPATLATSVWLAITALLPTRANAG